VSAIARCRAIRRPDAAASSRTRRLRVIGHPRQSDFGRRSKNRRRVRIENRRRLRHFGLLILWEGGFPEDNGRRQQRTVRRRNWVLIAAAATSARSICVHERMEQRRWEFKRRQWHGPIETRP